ncbi:MAG: DUF3021 domain-containing protein [Lentisphaerae bacterium]|nr:DUF3021 domain-containing protein [Lentisphaerota bacterium]MCP4102809.1 DUF3021 domain-containing protein [Lentisphaerota bacterium]
MLTLFISLIIAVAAGFASSFDLTTVWCVFNGVVVFAVCWIVIGLLIRRKVNKVNASIQEIMASAQAKINRKMNAFQNRPGANVKSVQKTLEKEQAAAVQEAINATGAMEKFFKWNILLKKQITTMRMMLYYQIRDFAKVDELLPGCLLFDPRAIAFKLARMYKKNDPKLEKFFRKKVKHCKGENSALLYGLYSWILVKQGEADKAFELLTAARKKTDNSTIVENREKLANGKVKHFSNSGLGELWYSLYLEEPKIKQQRMHRRF